MIALIAVIAASWQPCPTIPAIILLAHVLYAVHDLVPLILTVIFPRAEKNLYTAELAAISLAIRCLPPDLQGRQLTIFTSNQAALLALSQPKQQSGQISIAQIYNIARTLRQRSNRVLMAWVP